MPQVLLAWGLPGVIGIAGCYLIVCAIAGRIFSLKKFFAGCLLDSMAKRATLAAFGFVLAVPLIWAIYGQVVFGSRGSLFSPSIPEKVVDTKIPTTLEPLYRRASWVPSAERPSPIVESFGLDLRSVRQLQSTYFNKSVYLYVTEHQSTKSNLFEIWVVVADPATFSSGPLSEAEFMGKIRRSSIPPQNIYRATVQQTGQTMLFNYSDNTYLLTVKNIYAVLFGNNKIAVEISTPPGAVRRSLQGRV
jgi:hypothetical protein